VIEQAASSTYLNESLRTTAVAFGVHIRKIATVGSQAVAAPRRKNNSTVEGNVLAAIHGQRGGVMKKQVLFALLTMVLLMAAGSANAQLGSKTELRFNVPFDYKVGNGTMKAGDCSIRRAGTENVLVIRCNGSSALALSGSVSGKAASETKLVFNKYGDQYFLAQVWVQGENIGEQLPRTRIENELMSKAQPDSVVILARK
jgi:hypothetical protein